MPYIRQTILAIVLGAALAACATPPAQSSAQVTATGASAEALSVTLHTPRENLYTTAQPAASDWSVIAGKGVRTVINLRTKDEMQGRDESAEVAAAGMHYIEIPVMNADAINAGNARKLHQALQAAFQDGPVLLHCASVNRAGGLLALAMATEHGMSLDEALKVGRDAGMKSTENAVRKAVEGN